MRFGYGRGAEVLHGIDLDVPAGTTVALVGHTGAGKSTIAKLLARFYDPREGRITIDGIDLRDVTQASLRRQLGVVPQEGFLFAGTVRENIAFGRPGREPRGRRARRRRRSAPTTSSSELEDGYDTELQERGIRLSLGQRQLVAFARALLADPRILILDEATSSVDIGTERRIEAALDVLLARPHRVHHRPPPLDDPERRPDRRARARAGRRAGHARRADGPSRPLHRALRRLGRRGLVGSPAMAGEVFGQAWGLYKRFWRHFLPIALVIFGVLSVVSVVLGALFGALGLFLAFVASLVGIFWLQGALDARSPGCARRARRPVDRRDDQPRRPATSARCSPPGLLAGLGIVIGLALLIAPGLLLATWWALIVPAIVLEHKGVFESFGRSRELVRGHGWQVLGVIVLGFLISIGASLLLSLLLIWIPGAGGAYVAQPRLEHADHTVHRGGVDADVLQAARRAGRAGAGPGPRALAPWRSTARPRSASSSRCRPRQSARRACRRRAAVEQMRINVPVRGNRKLRTVISSASTRTSS